MRKTSRLSCQLTGVLTLGLALGCKPKGSDAQVKSLDNLTRGDAPLQLNQCKGTFKGTGYAAKIDVSALADARKAGALSDVETALTAVPDDFKKSFFATGKIKLLPDATQACRALLPPDQQKFATENNSQSPITICWDLKSDPTNLVAIIQDKPEIIAHQTVRLFAYLIVHIDSVIVDQLSPEMKAKLKDLVAKNERLKATKLALPRALLKDAENDPKMDVSSIRDELQSGDPQRIEETANAVFAEAIDSRFCNAQTKASFEKRFSVTRDVLLGLRDPKTLAKKGVGLALEDDPKVTVVRPQSLNPYVYREDRTYSDGTVRKDPYLYEDRSGSTLLDYAFNPISNAPSAVGNQVSRGIFEGSRAFNERADQLGAAVEKAPGFIADGANIVADNVAANASAVYDTTSNAVSSLWDLLP